VVKPVLEHSWTLEALALIQPLKAAVESVARLHIGITLVGRLVARLGKVVAVLGKLVTNEGNLVVHLGNFAANLGKRTTNVAKFWTNVPSFLGRDGTKPAFSPPCGVFLFWTGEREANKRRDSKR